MSNSSKQMELRFQVLGGSSVSPGTSGGKILIDIQSIVSQIEKNGVTKLKFSINTSGISNGIKNQTREIDSASKYWQGRFKDSVKDLTAPNLNLKSLNAQYKQAEQYGTQFLQKNLTGIDYEIKARELAGKQFSSQLKAQMQAEQDALATNERTTKQEVANAKEKANTQRQYNLTLSQARDYYDKYADKIAKMPGLNSKWQTYQKNLLNPSDNFDSTTDSRNQLTLLQKVSREAGVEVETLGGKLKKLFNAHFSTAIAMIGVHLLYQSLQQIYTNVVEIDTAMTSLKKVTDETDTAYAEFLDNATIRAQQLGAALSDVVQATADFSRLGFNLDDASTLADAALVYKNVGDGITNVTTASESLISTIKSFGIAASDSMSIVDAYNEVGNNFAMTSYDIGVALQTASSALASANNSMEESIGLAVGMNATVQNAEKVGTTLKTMSMYLRAAKTEAEEAGESTDGMANSVSELQDELLKLTNNKVDIMIDDSTFKSTYQIAKELSEVWSSLSDIDTANILELIGGKRNASAVSSLLTNFADAEAAMETASNSTGSALKENETYLDSIEGKFSQLEATFQSFSTNVLDSGLIKFFVDLSNGILKGADALAQIHLLIPLIIAGFVTLKSAAKPNTDGSINVAAVA